MSGRSALLALALLLAAAPALAARRDRPPLPPQGPNVVLIVADDLGVGELGCYSYAENVRTPHIDALAEQGVRMTSGYAADPFCWPSRASILTGKYHQRFASVRPVPEGERMVAHALKDAGYATACIGKWHNTGSIGAFDGRPVNHPSWWGFDDFFGFLGAVHDYFDADVGRDRIGPRNRPIYMPMYENFRTVRTMQYQTDELTERAVQFIDRHATKPWPFFLYLPYGAIHGPDQAPERYLDRNDGDVRLAMIDALDEGVGRVLAALDERGLADSTIVFFVSDNGGYRETSNGPLRGGKSRLYEGGIRVPFLARWPGRIPAGSVYLEPVMHIDLAPTLLAAAGAPSPTGLDGVNLLPHLRGAREEAPHEALFFGATNGARFAVRHGSWKLVHEADSLRGERTTKLYHLGEDEGERDDRSGTEPEIADALRARYDDWASRMAPVR